MQSNRLKVYGGVLLFLGVIVMAFAIASYNSAESQLARALGMADNGVLMLLLYGFVYGVVGIVMLASQPAVLLRLNHGGLVVFSLLLIVFPLLCWIPWVIPGLNPLQKGGAIKMTEEKKPASLMRRIISVVLLTIGSGFILAQPLATYPRIILGASLEYGVVIFSFILGGAFVWVGGALWGRWQIALGVIWLVFGIGVTASSPQLKSLAQQKPGESGWLLAMSTASLRIGLIYAVIGAAWIILQKYRDKHVSESKADIPDSVAATCPRCGHTWMGHWDVSLKIRQCPQCREVWRVG